ncbi:MAG: Hsp20/alpha crystallin family protein [Alphaproteobacteria bacterium]|nr:Hsp20/alpha crystallin family protein [Alphaproteobacteria bacterium]
MSWPHLFEPFRSAAHSVANFFSPEADAANAEDRYEINIELPGVDAEDIDVTLHDHVLTIKGEKTENREEKGKTFYFSERRYGAFQRSFRLPSTVSADQVNATFKNGILTLGVPKLNPAQEEARKIPIQSE